MVDRLRLAALGCLVMALVGCSGDSVDIQQGGDLQEPLRKLGHSAHSVRLSVLTDFSWDAVHVFQGYTPEDEINRAVGQPIVGGDYGVYRVDEGSNLLVFTSGGRVVKAVTVTPDLLLTDGRRTWSPRVRLEPTSGPSPPEGYLRLVEPGHADAP